MGNVETDLLLNKWKNPVITGDKQPRQPSLLGFKGTVKALEILNKHIQNNSRIAVHSDIDVDGVGSGYIANKFLSSQGCKAINLINKERVHGIQTKHIEYFNNVNNCDLLIILDSSSNALDIIKELKCDVIVVDHHEIGHTEHQGYTNNKEYEYVIINNMIGNKNNEEISNWLREINPDTKEYIEGYKVERRMSGALVLYELIRIYCEAYQIEKVLENSMLYQWVGVTLLSDSILLGNDRNQWYMDKTVHNMNMEPSLKVILKELNKFKGKLDKSFISFSFAPTINKAIRAGASGEVLDIIINRPKDIKELQKYSEEQDIALEKGLEGEDNSSKEYVIKDITDKGVSKNYCGVIASRIAGDYNKNVVVFMVDGNNRAKGSFRGRRTDVDYRKYFEEYEEGIFAQGHRAAFGFEADISILDDMMEGLSNIEPTQSRLYLTAGNIPNSLKGEYHINNMDNFKKLGYLWRLAIGNSKLSSMEQLEIIIPLQDIQIKERKGKLYIYESMGLECKAFEELSTQLISIYVEFSNAIDIYARNYYHQ